jgi:outer membrane protein OmpA-like peptidoglycan-associated protein
MGAGEYRPESKRGLHLLAHEVGHALQRSEGELRRQAAPGEARSSDVAAAEEGASPRYEPGEVERSRSDEGIHEVDVHEDVVGGATALLIADFGVGQSDIKSSTKEESLLKRWLERFAGSSNYQLVVEGSTDSVGSAATNSRLKRLRAQSFLELLDPSTRSRTTVVSSGPGVFGFSNDTPEGRAANRSVIVQVKSSVEMEGEPVEVERRSPGQIIEHARSVYRSEGSRADEDWTMYGSLTMLLESDTDDRYIDGWLWQSYGANVAKGSVKNLREEILEAVNPNASNGENMREIRRLSRQIESGICYALSANRLSAGGGSALSPCHRDIIEWMKRQTEDSSSIYHTWKDARVDPRCASLGIDTRC